MKSEYSQTALLAKLFRGFGDENRLKTLKTLQECSKSVGDITKALDLPQSTVSTHLRCLKDCNLVRSEKVSRKNIYSLASQKISKIIDIAEDLLKDVYLEIWECVNYNGDEHIE